MDAHLKDLRWWAWYFARLAAASTREAEKKTTDTCYQSRQAGRAIAYNASANVFLSLANDFAELQLDGTGLWSAGSD